jgi:hypothetical protein
LSLAHDVLSLENPAITSLHVMLVSFIFHSKLICEKVNDFFPPLARRRRKQSKSSKVSIIEEIVISFGGIVISDSIQV